MHLINIITLTSFAILILYLYNSIIIMPLHEYLEQKRRQNIKDLNERGACHICGSTCRPQHFNEEKSSSEAIVAAGGNYNENSMVPAPSLAPMRTCACFGMSPSDPDYWPYSVSVIMRPREPN